MLVGRGVLRNPWILAQAADLAAGRPARASPTKTAANFLLDYMDLLLNEENEPSGFRHRAARERSRRLRADATGTEVASRAVGYQQTPRADVRGTRRGFITAATCAPQINAAGSIAEARDIIRRFFVGIRLPSALKSKSADNPAMMLALAAAVLLAAVACGGPSNAQPVLATYDQETGKLSQLTANALKDGKPNVTSYMDGTKFVRIEIDADEDGKIDRWEYYGTTQQVDRVGMSRANDGKPDAWIIQGSTGPCRALRYRQTATVEPIGLSSTAATN